MEESKSIEDNNVTDSILSDEENALVEKNGAFHLLSEEGNLDLSNEAYEAESSRSEVQSEQGDQAGSTDSTPEIQTDNPTGLRTTEKLDDQSGSQTSDSESRNQPDNHLDDQIAIEAEGQSPEDDFPKGEGDLRRNDESAKETMNEKNVTLEKEKNNSPSLRRSKTTHEMIENARKEHSAKVKKSKEETAKREQEKREKDERNKNAFEAWCRKKEEEDRQRREKERQEKEKIYQDMDDKNRRQEEEARKSFHEWMKKKNTQAQQDKLLQEYKRQEEQSILYTRTQEDSDAAFTRWLKQKRQQEEQQLKLIRLRNKRINKMRQRWERYNYRSFFDNTSL